MIPDAAYPSREAWADAVRNDSMRVAVAAIVLDRAPRWAVAILWVSVIRQTEILEGIPRGHLLAHHS